MVQTTVSEKMKQVRKLLREIEDQIESHLEDGGDLDLTPAVLISLAAEVSAVHAEDEA